MHSWWSGEHEPRTPKGTFQDHRKEHFERLRKEHFKIIKSLRNNPEIIITRPDKGKGVVILRRKDYIDKLTTILNDTSKFTRLGPCTRHDSTARFEMSLPDMLRELKKNGEISDEIYKRIRPTGSIRPRMYGVPKVHKAGVPMRPILSMIPSPQHGTANG